jgi:hypothetical protein
MIAVATESVLLLAYVAATLSLVMVAILSGKRVVRYWTGRERDSLADRWLDVDNRRAAYFEDDNRRAAYFEDREAA